MPVIKVNDKEVIKTYRYYHCFKLSESSYALFDIKMDMPIIIGSIAIIKSTQLPPNSIIFSYKLNSVGFFEKEVKKTIEIKGDGKHLKPPLRYHYLNNKKIFYHHFKMSEVLSVLFDDEFNMPITYGSNQKIQAILNKINKTSTIFYYKEDTSVKNSFKLFMTYKGKG